MQDSNRSWRYFTRSRLVGIFACAMVVLILTVIGLRWSANRGLANLIQIDMVAEPEESSELVVVVPGLTGNVDTMSDVIEATRTTRPNADIMLVAFPSQTFSNADCFQMALMISEQIGERYDNNHYDSITLVGYSIGALLIRKSYVYGHGLIDDSAPNEELPAEEVEAQPWTESVDRFVLLAGTNRGWSTRSRPRGMSLLNAFKYRTGIALAWVSGTGKMMLQVRRGEPFVANLRLQWLKAMRRLAPSRRPQVIQCLGDQDDVVSSVDNRDVAVSRDFIWVQFNGTGHANATDFSNGPYAADRRRKFEAALGNKASIAKLRRRSSILPDDTDEAVTTAVIVLHGIRDLGQWTSEFENSLQLKFQDSHRGKLVVHRPSYGYFGMGPFLLWTDRQRNVRWFMDEFTELKAKYPNLEDVHFIGHSNGTYVLASALKRYKSMSVQRVVFAGSVLRRDFDWGALQGRISALRNYVGASDWVVGIFPKLFELPIVKHLNPDIGSAGFDGFTHTFAEDGQAQVRYVMGTHSAGLREENRDAIISFIIDGKIVQPHQDVVATKQDTLISWCSKLCWLIWMVIVIVVLLLGFCWFRFVGAHLQTRWKWPFGAARSAAIISYAFLIWMIVYTI